jgi:hypothetical protein
MTDELTSENFASLAVLLASWVFILAQEKGFTLPFEVTGESDGRIVFCDEVNAQGQFRNLFDQDHKLHGRFPLTISINDRSGNIWEKTLTESDLL